MGVHLARRIVQACRGSDKLPRGPNPKKTQQLCLPGWHALGFKSRMQSWFNCSSGWLTSKVARKRLLGIIYFYA